MDHFSATINKLTQEDLSVLHALCQSESYTSYSSIPKTVIVENTKLSDSAFRKSISHLERIAFIEVVTGSKSHYYYISHFGQRAIELITEKVEVELWVLE